VSGVVAAGVWVPEVDLDDIDDEISHDIQEGRRLLALDILRGMLDDEVMKRGEI
jgi:hypothetical protein